MPAVANFLSSALSRYRRSSGLVREAGSLAIGILAGLVLLPLAIWIGGQAVLGDYIRDPVTGATGGPGGFWSDYLGALGEGSTGHWMVLLGPYVIYSVLRLGNRLLKL
jgi:hypothetical protein